MVALLSYKGQRRIGGWKVSGIHNPFLIFLPNFIYLDTLLSAASKLIGLFGSTFLKDFGSQLHLFPSFAIALFCEKLGRV